ncbi:Uncharacterized protein dnm_030560 [Desulfonema magnum]|uniref:Uncharacterized protein n=1 Tax=Desulfonema magnum TaxID=45655 RepID=A0A975GMQ3_9BACT|nr:Uncharacterized protein dnm_030560 [Desulfonema magnum]
MAPCSALYATTDKTKTEELSFHLVSMLCVEMQPGRFASRN